VALGVLALLPGRFDAVFVVSAAFALVGLAVLVLLVPGRGRPSTSPDPEAGNGSAETGVPRLTGADLAALARSRPYVARVGVAGLLTVFTVSDAFVFLALLGRDAGLTKVFPLLAVGLALAYAVMAIPVGRLADRWGRMRLFVAGHVILLAVYAVAGGPVGTAPATVAVLLLLGLFYACTDGVLAAAVSAILPEVSRASGLSFAQSFVAVSGFVSSLGFGLLLGRLGPASAYLVMGLGLAVAIPAAAVLLRRPATRAVAP
jgi:MFS family permease